MNKSPIAIDLYSGCGGLTQGLEDAGYRVAAAVEIDPDACSTYRANHRNTHLCEKDIMEVSPTGLCDQAGLMPADLTLLAACAPCQFFSRQNKFHEKDETWLVRRFVDFAAVLKPPIVLMENVPELKSGRGKSVYSEVVKSLERLGYEIYGAKLDAADFGLPQHRKRLILVGAQDKRMISILKENREPVKARNVEDAISHLPALEAGGKSQYHPWHCCGFLSPLNIERLQHTPVDGGDRRSWPDRLRLECHRKFDGYTDVYGRLWWKQPSRTITTGFTSITKGRFAHPEQLRGLSVLEGALLQGFSETYDFRGTRTSIARQIGNAVPPPFIASFLRPTTDSLSRDDQLVEGETP